MKTIYIKSDEEIISIIDRLFKSGDSQVDLAIPTGAQIWQSSINLKLLKREADNLNKQVALVVDGDLEAEMAETAGFPVKREQEFPIEMIEEEPEMRGVEEIEEEVEKPKEIEIELASQKDFEEMEDNIDSEVHPKETEEAEEIKKDNKGMFGTLVNQLESEKKSVSPFTFHSRKSSEEETKKMTDIVSPDTTRKRSRLFSAGIVKKKIFDKTKKLLKPLRPQRREENIQQEEIEIVQEEQAPQRKTSNNFNFSWSKLLIGFVILALVVVIIISYVILPTTEIKIRPKSEKINFTLQVVGTADVSQVDDEDNRIPLEEIEVTKTKTKKFESTGEKEISEKAKGNITVYNEYSSSPQTLVATTRFESPDGKIFRIMKSVTVPGAQIVENKIVASTLEIEVTADEAGEDYNIEPTNFIIPGFKGSPKFSGFYGESKETMAGGSNKKIKIISSDDIKKAKEDVLESLKKEIKDSFYDQIPDDLTLIAESLKEKTTIISDVEEELEAEDFEMEVKAVMNGFLYREDDLKNLAEIKATSELSEDKVLVGDGQSISREDVTFDSITGEILFLLSVEQEVAISIDVESIKSDLSGKKEVEVRKYLTNHSDIQSAEVSFWPFWAKRVPKQREKIKISIE